MIKSFLFGLLLFCGCFELMSQTIIGSSATANASSILQLESTSKGLKLPQMTATERTNISSPAEGLIIFQTTSPSGIYIYQGSTWKNLNADDTGLISIYAENGGGQTLSYTTLTGISNWDVGLVDNSSGAWNRSTGEFTAPRDMTVWASARITFANHNQLNYFEYGGGFQKNGTGYTPYTYAFSSGSSSNNFKSINGIAAIIQLSKGDKLQLWSRHAALTAAGSQTSLTTHSNGTYILITELPDYK